MEKVKLGLLEYQEIFRNGLVNLLENESTLDLLCACATGSQTIQCIRQYHPDILLMDIEPPEAGADKVLHFIHRRRYKTRIIILTHSETDSNLISAIALGVNAYLSKDIKAPDLVKVISLVANGEFVLSPPMAQRILEDFNYLERGKDNGRLFLLLSKREQMLIALVAQGFTNKQIAENLFISENTVKVHLLKIMEKLHAHTRQQAVNLVRGKDLLSLIDQTDTEQA